MGLIDFTEIPSSTGGNRGQDQWELFAEDFLSALGLEIAEPPARGPDGGKDLLAIEVVNGPVSTDRKRWLVSCKHFAHSDASVGMSDEKSVLARVNSFDADGFIGFYSTVTSTGLQGYGSRFSNRGVTRPAA